MPRALVLQAAFFDRTSPRLGVAAWLSSRERAELLTRHQPGNRRVAARHGLGDRLYREPPPDPTDNRPPPPGPDLPRLLEIDRRARHAKMPDGSRLRLPLLARVALWANAPQTDDADRAAAQARFATIAGHPRIRSCVVDRLSPSVFLRYGWRCAFVARTGLGPPEPLPAAD